MPVDAEDTSPMDDLHDLVRVNVRRILYIAEVSGVWLMLFGSAILTALVVTATIYNIEFAQAVLLMSYEWMGSGGAELPIGEPESLPARKEDLFGLFDHLEGALEKENYFRPPHKKATMVENLRNIFQKASLSQQEIHALRGVVATLEGRKTRPRKDRQAPKTAKTSKSRKRQD